MGSEENQIRPRSRNGPVFLMPIERDSTPRSGLLLQRTRIDQGTKYLFVAFVAIVWYNAFELILLCLTTFKRYSGLYFWSLLVGSVSLIPHMLGFFFFFFAQGVVAYLDVVLIILGWYGMVTGHSLVLWSRLHLVMRKPKLLRALLWMIIINAFLFHVPITVFLFGAVSSDSVFYTRAYNVMERIQLIGFAVQECILSGLYVYETLRMLHLRPSDHQYKSILIQLLVINVVISVLDCVVVAIEFAGYAAVQVMFKPFAYSIKFKLEYAILGRLIQIAKGNSTESSSTRGFNSLPSDYTFTYTNNTRRSDSMAYVEDEDTYASIRYANRANSL